MLEEAMRITSGPVALRWPKTPARHVDAGEVGHGRSARRCATGGDVCILAVGKMVEAAEEAADAARGRATCTRRCGTSARSRPTRRCWPTPAVTALVVTAEDGIAEGGVGALLAAALGALEAETPPPTDDHARHAARVPAARQAGRPARQPRARRPGHRRDRGQAARRASLSAGAAPEVGHAVERGRPVVVELERLSECEQPGGAEIGPHEHLDAVVGERGAVVVPVAEDGRRVHQLVDLRVLSGAGAVLRDRGVALEQAAGRGRVREREDRAFELLERRVPDADVVERFGAGDAQVAEGGGARVLVGLADVQVPR